MYRTFTHQVRFYYWEPPICRYNTGLVVCYAFFVCYTFSTSDHNWPQLLAVSQKMTKTTSILTPICSPGHPDTPKPSYSAQTPWYPYIAFNTILVP